MTPSAPVRIPVELRQKARWFRMAAAVSPLSVSLTSAIPEELDGPMEVAFQLPGEIEVVRCKARAADPLELRFLDLDPSQRARIERYLSDRKARPRG